MSSVYANCANCGVGLTPEDYLQPACRYCGAAHRHHQEAATKAAELNAVMQGFMAQIPPARGMPGAAPPVVVVPGMQQIVHSSTTYVVGGPTLGASPPMTGGPVGGAPMGASAAWNGRMQAPLRGNPVASLRWIALAMTALALVVGAVVAASLFAR